MKRLFTEVWAWLMEPAREKEPWYLIREGARKKIHRKWTSLLPMFAFLLAPPTGQPPHHWEEGQQEKPGDAVYCISLWIP